MTWVGGLALCLGALLLAAVAGYGFRQVVHRRARIRTATTSYAARLECENGERDKIDETADALVREYGASAVIAAAKRVIPTLNDDDRRTRAVWHQVLKSAEQSQREAQRRKAAAE